jgi:hypothetical protein
MTSDAPLGLMMATMEPPADIEEEFQAWYDTEHFPERQGCAGFLTANRFVCIDGWPRYLAAYDLEDIEVMRDDAYRAIAHARYSPWTHRIIGKVWGQYRAEAVQAYPGRALHGGGGAASRMALWRLRRVGRGREQALVDALRGAYEPRPETVQLRVFRVSPSDAGDYLAMAELRLPFVPPADALGEFVRHVDLLNTYVVYARQAPNAFPATPEGKSP